MLAVLYITGDGVPEQVVKAAEWYTKAAEQGHVEAQFNIGVLYVNGIGVQLDFAKAGEWFSKAASQGSAAAEFNLSMMHLRGDGFEKNLQRAAELMASAAEKGLPLAQYHLGIMYSNGEGVSRDLVQAYKWADLAVKSPDAAAPDLREFLANMMTSDQVVEAQRMSERMEAQNKVIILIVPALLALLVLRRARTPIRGRLPEQEFELGQSFEKGPVCLKILSKLSMHIPDPLIRAIRRPNPARRNVLQRRENPQGFRCRRCLVSKGRSAGRSHGTKQSGADVSNGEGVPKTMSRLSHGLQKQRKAASPVHSSILQRSTRTETGCP